MASQLVRPPVVTILGHVDHGKTSLLDRIRNSNVQAKELGGITQAIGAYQISFQNQLITFIDTPGHAAFSSMRARGGKVADVVILVVAADDAVMPQTRESIDHIRAAKVPFIVAINKVDLPDANVQKVKTTLAEYEVYVEGYGGNTPVVELSAKTGQGVNDLLEMIVLLSEVEGLTDTSQDSTKALVIESQLHPQKGPIATLLVKSGCLKSKDSMYDSNKSIGKVRTMFNSNGGVVDSASPSTPVQVLGFTQVPAVGEIITTSPNETSDLVAQSYAGFYSKDTDPTKSFISIVLKTDVAGSLEAILGSLPPQVYVHGSSVGAVSESDVQLAVANHSLIVCFNTKANASVAKLATTEGVEIISFGIIYELFDYLKDFVSRAETAKQPIQIGEAKILKLFEHLGTTIFGCQVVSGKLRVGDRVDTTIIKSLRVGRESLKEVKKGLECGMVLETPLDVKPGDVILSHNIDA